MEAVGDIRSESRERFDGRLKTKDERPRTKRRRWRIFAPRSQQPVGMFWWVSTASAIATTSIDCSDCYIPSITTGTGAQRSLFRRLVTYALLLCDLTDWSPLVPTDSHWSPTTKERGSPVIFGAAKVKGRRQFSWRNAILSVMTDTTESALGMICNFWGLDVASHFQTLLS